MKNPFNAGEAVLTKVKGKEVQASVTKTWKNEVQVKTADGDLLWRSMYTVWRSGEAPLSREVAAKATPAQPPRGVSKAAGEAPVVPTKSRKQKSPASKSRRNKRS